MQIDFYILILYIATSLNSSMNSSSFLDEDTGCSHGQNKRDPQTAMGSHGEQRWLSISQEYAGAARSYREEREGPGIQPFAELCQGAPCHNPDS